MIPHYEPRQFNIKIKIIEPVLTFGSLLFMVVSYDMLLK